MLKSRVFRLAIYDVAMGSMIQNYAKRNKLEGKLYRGDRFSNWSCNMNGNNDILSITEPQIIRNIYNKYLERGGAI